MSEPNLNRAQSQPCMGIDIAQMYKIATREATSWGIEGYQVPRKYHDHIKKKKEDEINEMIKKGKKPGWPPLYKEPSKRGNFLDDEIKSKFTKVPCQYNLGDKWKMADEKKKFYSMKNKVDQNHDKKTYIQQIVKFEQKNKFPGPGAHNVTKTQKQIEEEQKKMQQKVVKYGDLPNYLNDYEWQGEKVPGPGNYNPKQTTKDTFEWENNKKNLTANVYYTIQPKDWIKKHNKKGSKVDLSKIDPFPVSYETFGKKMMNTKEGKDKSAIKYWGNTKRIYSMKEEKARDEKLKRVNPPGAGTYSLLAKWPDSKPGEKNKAKSKTQLFDYNRISKGTESTRSIYY